MPLFDILFGNSNFLLSTTDRRNHALDRCHFAIGYVLMLTDNQKTPIRSHMWVNVAHI